MAMKVQCLKCPASVHSTNATWHTSFGLTQRHWFIFSSVSDSPHREALFSGRLLNGHWAVCSALRAGKSSSRMRGTNPFFTFAPMASERLAVLNTWFLFTFVYAVTLQLPISGFYLSTGCVPRVPSSESGLGTRVIEPGLQPYHQVSVPLEKVRYFAAIEPVDYVVPLNPALAAGEFGATACNPDDGMSRSGCIPSVDPSLSQKAKT